MNLNIEAAIVNVCLLCILTVPHEFAHAWVATKLGDDTPDNEGRLTLYPPAHIDLLGTVILPALMTLFGGGLLGWGRPVNTDVYKLKWGVNGLALVALAGPASNILLAILFAGLSIFSARFMADVSEFSSRAALLSVYLAVFNLLPVPPLDGSKLLIAARLPVAIYNELGRFGFLLLIVAMTATSMGMYMGITASRITDVIFGLFY